MTRYGFDRCAVCRVWFEASLVSASAVGPICHRCRDANVDWAASEPPGAVPAAVPLDRAKRLAGHPELPGLEGT